MKMGSCGLHCEVAQNSSFLTLTTVGSDVSFHLKFAVSYVKISFKNLHALLKYQQKLEILFFDSCCRFVFDAQLSSVTYQYQTNATKLGDFSHITQLKLADTLLQTKSRSKPPSTV